MMLDGNSIGLCRYDFQLLGDVWGDIARPVVAEEHGCIPPLISQDARVTVGRYTYGNPELKVWTESDQIIIGAFCSIAEKVVIFGGGEHRTDWITTYPLRIALNSKGAGEDGHPRSKGATKIGNDVWLGYGAVILSGVTIGDGACVGAGAVVSSDVPPYAIVIGNPAQITRMRFEETVCKQLLSIAWWEWPINKIRTFEELLCSGNVNEFIQTAFDGNR